MSTKINLDATQLLGYRLLTASDKTTKPVIGAKVGGKILSPIGSKIGAKAGVKV
ncbi:MAG: hypothetical protein WD534_04760 [Phycisphaeraceae bacterium]